MFGNKYNLTQKIVLLTPVLFLVGVIFYYLTPHTNAAPWFGEPIYKVLGDTGSGMGQVTARVWNITINIVNSFVLALLIYVSFMNILRIQMDSYAVKKFLPTFIMTIILANFSFLIARIIIDLGNIVISAFLVGNQQNNLSGVFDELIEQVPIGPGKQEGGANYYAVITGYIFKQFFVIAGAIMMFILSFIFLIRNYMLYFLIAIAPLGFLAMALPITKKYFQQWWSNFTKWVFMPVISVFWLWLGGQFVGSIDTGGIWILPVAFGGLCLYLAITTPFKVGGAVLGAWTKFGKQAGRWGYGQVGNVGARTSELGQNLRKKYKDSNSWQNRLGGRMDRIGGVINLPANVEAVKKGRKERQNLLRKAEVKTPTYNRLGGPQVRFEAAQATLEDEIKYAPPRTIASKFTPMEDQAWMMARRNRTRGERNLRLELENRVGGAERFAQIADTTEGEAEIRQAIRHFASSDGARNLHIKLAGSELGRSEEDFVMLQEQARRANADLRNWRTFDDFQEVYREVPPPEGMGPRPPLPEPGRQRRRREDNGEATSAVPAASGTPTILGSDGRPYRQTDGGKRSGESIPERDSELTGYLHDLLDEFRNLEQTLGGRGKLGGEGGYDQLLGEISKMKPNLTLDNAGLVAAILPKLNVNVESMSPQALEQWGRKIRQVSEGVNKISNGIEAKNASVLRQIATVIRDGANPAKLAQGRQAIGEAGGTDTEAANTEEGEGNG
jgi:hypothetical protein